MAIHYGGRGVGEGRAMNGLLVLDKPGGMTSRDALDRAAAWFPRRTKIGHAGTLDPLATGVLVLCVGQATRLVEYVQAMGKVYRTALTLGATSDTDDADGAVTLHPDARPVDRSVIDTELHRLIGQIEQVPPAYSAAKVDGRRAYDRARRGEGVELAPRTVRVDRIDVLRYEYPELELEIACGKGTYVRSIGRDLGARLGCGAYVKTLRRLRIGRFDAADAVTLEAGRAEALAKLRPMGDAVAELPAVPLDARTWERLRNGQSVPCAGREDGDVAVFAGGAFVAVGRAREGVLTPSKVLG